MSKLLFQLIIPADENCLVRASNFKTESHSRPNCLIVQAANIVLDNTLVSSNSGSRDALKRYVSQLEDFALFGSDNLDFEVNNSRITPLPIHTEAFRDYLTILCELEQSELPLSKDVIQTKKSQSESNSNQEQADFKANENAATDIWTASLSPLWVDFTGPNSIRYPRPMPFVTDVPITVWLVPNIYNSRTNSGNTESAMVTVLVKPEGPLKLLLEQDQYVFLHQVIMDMGRLMQVLMDDAKAVAEKIVCNSAPDDKAMTDLSLCVCCIGPTIDISLLLPSSIATEAETSNDRVLSSSSSDASNTGK